MIGTNTDPQYCGVANEVASTLKGVAADVRAGSRRLKPTAQVRVMFLSISLGLSGCQRPEAAISLTGTPFDPQRPVQYVLYPGDLLSVSFPTEPKLDQEVRIRSDGMISLPYAGDVSAAQRTPAALAEALNEHYQKLLKEPAVTVIVEEEAGRLFYIGGEVRKPGSFQLRPNQTLVQALYEASGRTLEAHQRQVLVMRSQPGAGIYVLKADIKTILAGKDADVRLEPLDIVHVPASNIARVGRWVEQYINSVIPRAFAFPFTTELATQPIRVVDNQSSVSPVQINRRR
jgi:polysaccharide export outer membrane protein